MASGIPVVGSRLTCGPEIVPSEVAGLLADPAHPEEIARQVVRLLRDPQLRGRMGRSGRQIAETRFSLEVGVARTLEFYRCCLEGRPLPRHLTQLPGEA
jgi:glycosyltransferase involved in cell wall biosynthesis